MIVKGSFDPIDRRPYVQGLLLIPRRNKRSRIDFLVDTGSDVTTLSPGDGRRMGIDYCSLAYTEPFLGAGSSHKAAVERAIVVFASEDGTLPVYLVRLSITPYSLKNGATTFSAWNRYLAQVANLLGSFPRPT